jgi:Tol biopolymer transport system component
MRPLLSNPNPRVHRPRRATTAIALGVAALFAAAAPPGPAQAAPDDPGEARIQRVSVAHTGAQAALDSNNTTYGIGADGRYVYFLSNDSTLAPGDSNGTGGLFARDLLAGTTIRITGTGPQADPVPATARGRYVAFTTLDTDLVPGDTNGFSDVFVRDLRTGTTTRVSLTRTGGQGSADSLGPIVSADGRYVAFSSFAPHMARGDRNGERLDAFVRDMRTGTTTLASPSYTGPGGDNETGAAAVSANGRYVAIVSAASNLVPGDTNNALDVMIRDRTAGTTRLVSVSSTGAQGNGDSLNAAMTPDGRYVAFMSSATNLTPGDTNNAADVFVRDLRTGTTRMISTPVGGLANGDSHEPAISADGRYVTYYSHASNLVPGDTNNARDVYLWDQRTSTTTRISVGHHGAEPDGWSTQPRISADGRYIAFTSQAANLVPDDTNGTYDVFVHDRGSPADAR